MISNQESMFSKIKTDFSAINLKSFFSFSPFKSVVEGLLVTASYTVAAIFIPQVINLALGSIMGIMACAGLIAACYGGYNWYKLAKSENAAEQDLNQMKNLTFIGAGALMLSMTLSFSATVLPLLLAAVVGHRFFSSLTQKDWDNVTNLGATIGLSNGSKKV